MSRWIFPSAAVLVVLASLSSVVIDCFKNFGGGGNINDKHRSAVAAVGKKIRKEDNREIHIDSVGLANLRYSDSRVRPFLTSFFILKGSTLQILLICCSRPASTILKRKRARKKRLRELAIRMSKYIL